MKLDEFAANVAGLIAIFWILRTMTNFFALLCNE